MPSLLTNADLTYMRAVVADMLPDTCNILSESITPDGQGGVTSTWGTVSSSVACRLDDTSSATSQGIVPVGGGLKAAHQYQLSLPSSATINAGNRVEVSGSTYTVISVNDNQSWMAVARAVLELV